MEELDAIEVTALAAVDGANVIDTVCGPVSAAHLGPTSMHDHLIEDASVWHSPTGSLPGDSGIDIETLGDLRWNACELRDNLLLDDPDVALLELGDLAAAGGSGLVDVTTIDALAPRIPTLQRLSRATGVHVMVSAGWYVEAAHPVGLAERTVDDLTAELVSIAQNGVGDDAVRPAIIGEIGTSHPFTPAERHVLAASAQAAADVGLALSIHVEPAGDHALDALDVAVAAGMSPSRVILDHLDGRLDLDYHRRVLSTGAIVEYDTFGLEVGLDFGSEYVRTPSDLERIDALAMLLDEGWRDQLVLGCDVWLKTQLRRYGGYGYDHLVSRILPMLQRRHGVESSTIDCLMIDNPRRLLVREAPYESAWQAEEATSQ